MLLTLCISSVVKGKLEVQHFNMEFNVGSYKYGGETYVRAQ